MATKKFTLGIEEEFQILESDTYTLRSQMSKILEGGKVFLKERIKEEMHQSVVEMGTNICGNVQEARDEISYLRQQIIELAGKEGGSLRHPSFLSLERPAYYPESEVRQAD